MLRLESRAKQLLGVEVIIIVLRRLEDGFHLGQEDAGWMKFPEVSTKIPPHTSVDDGPIEIQLLFNSLPGFCGDHLHLKEGVF